MSWESIVGHKEVIQALRGAAEIGRLPHGMLFVGPRGVGKWTFARTFAQSLLCPKRLDVPLDSCNECPSCRQVISGDHPDLIDVKRPEDRHELPIASIRTMIRQLGLKPGPTGRKIAIIDDADDLNAEAANAMLKVLEEPPEGAILILIGTETDRQLETITSRCRVVRFDRLQESELADLLVRKGYVNDQTEARRLSTLAEGSLQRALGLADVELMTFRQRSIEALSQPDRLDPTDWAKEIEEFVNAAGKESLPRRLRAEQLISEYGRFFRMLLWELGECEPSHLDPSDRLTATTLSNKVDPELVCSLIDRCFEAIGHLHRRVYVPILLESFTNDVVRLLTRIRP